MSTSEAAPATPDAKPCCAPKSCCAKKGCGTDGKSCCCCGTCLAYLGAGLLLLAGFSALCIWMTRLNPIYAMYLETRGAAFSSGSQFCMTAGRWLALNWFAPPLVLIGVVAVHRKCCARCAVKLLFTYGLLVTAIALGGMICTGIDLAVQLPLK